MELFSIRYQEEKVCFTVQDAARFLSVSNGCIYQLIHEGKLPAQFVSHRYIIKAADLMNFLNQNDQK